jgi:D-alanine-D-alanine ligase
MKKLGIIFGGRSDEHEISILSAASVIGAVDGDKYLPVPIGINRKGEWFLIKGDMDDLSTLDDPRLKTLIPHSVKDGAKNTEAESISPGNLRDYIDFAFPVLHGPYGEDGKVQGLFELLDLPYAGCGVTASAIAMDKVFTRDILIRNGLPMCRHILITEDEFSKDPVGIERRIQEELGFPIFVKPANLGSSVGISKVTDAHKLELAMREALQFDDRLIIEEGIDVRELEIGVLGNITAETAAVGEIIPSAEFYDYDAKYRSDGTKLIIPADIHEDISAEIKRLAILAYKALNCEGFARTDFFLDRKSGRILVNEINTIPGFTRFSMFPLLWKEEGVKYTELIERIIGFGYERYFLKNNREANNAERRR